MQKILFTYFENIPLPFGADILHPNRRHHLQVGRQYDTRDHRVVHYSPSTAKSNPLRIPRTDSVHLHSTIRVATLLQHQTL